MPSTIWPYVTALLYFTRLSTCKAIAKTSKKLSHDCLTRMLRANWSGHTLLDWVLRSLFTVVGGYLIIDDTIIEKPHSKYMQEAFWNYSHKHKKKVFGVMVVLLIWTNDLFRIPIGFRVWKKGGPTKIELALDLLSYARNHLKVKPQFVLFDAWYPSKVILKRIRDYGWYFVCRLKSNRKFNGIRLKKYKQQPYWNDIGVLTGGIKVFVVKHRCKYFATNRLTLTAPQVRLEYKKRQAIEEVIKILKSELGLEDCQAGYERACNRIRSTPPIQAQEHHIALCLVAYLILEKERFKRKTSIRELRQDLIIKRFRIKLPVLAQLRDAA